MTWQQDYINLSSMLFLMGDAYAISNSNPGVVLDLEKKNSNRVFLRSNTPALQTDVTFPNSQSKIRTPWVERIRGGGHCILLILRRHSILRKGQFVFCVD